MAMPEQEIDPQLIDRTRREIGKLVTEIENLANQDIPPVEFFAEYLRRISSALAARATALWMMSQQGNLQIQFQINLQGVGFPTEGPDRQSHDELLRFILKTAKPLLVPPRSGPSEEEEAIQIRNPTDSLLVLAPIIFEGQPVGIIEVFQDPNRRSSAQQGYLQFLTRISNEAARFLKNKQFREVLSEQKLWNQLEAFARSVHGGLNPTQVAYLIANDGKKLIQAERVSVALKRGRKTVIESISGQSTVEKRSNLVTRMAKLANCVIKHGENLIYTGTIEDNWPKDTVQFLERYLDESGSKLIAVIPMPDQREFGARGKASAALVVEMIEDNASPEDMGGRIEVVARHGAIALYNALEHRRIFLLPVWKVLGDSMSWFTGHRLPKVVVALLVIAVTIAGLVFIPWPLRLEGRGELVPEVRRTVYAPVSGTIREVRVQHNDRVESGTQLAIMSNPELERELAELKGQLRSAEQLYSQYKADKQKERINKEIDEKITQQEVLIEGLKQQIQLVAEQMKTLNIESPIQGNVMDFYPKEKLSLRPVQQGDELLEIAQIDGDWVLEVDLPENTVTHIFKAQKERGDDPLPVTFVVSASPDQTYHGKLIELATAARAVEQENVIEAKIALDKEQGLPPLVAGVEVRVKVDCGPHAVGYVLFREVIDFLREYVFF